jgi:hypothetical protein
MSALHDWGRVRSGGAYRGPLDAGADADDAIPTRSPNTPSPTRCHTTHQTKSVKISRDETRPNNNNDNEIAMRARGASGIAARKGEGSGRALPIEARRNAGGGGRRGAGEAIGVFVTEPFLLSPAAAGVE